MKKFKEKVYRKVLKGNFSKTIYKRLHVLLAFFVKVEKIAFFMEAWGTGDSW